MNRQFVKNVINIKSIKKKSVNAKMEERSFSLPGVEDPKQLSVGTRGNDQVVMIVDVPSKGSHIDYYETNKWEVTKSDDESRVKYVGVYNRSPGTDFDQMSVTFNPSIGKIVFKTPFSVVRFYPATIVSDD